MDKPKKIILNHRSITLKQGNYYFWLEAKVEPSSAVQSVNFLSENTEIAVAKGQGRSCSVVAAKKGETEIIAFSPADESIKASCKIKIK